MSLITHKALSELGIPSFVNDDEGFYRVSELILYTDTDGGFWFNGHRDTYFTMEELLAGYEAIIGKPFAPSAPIPESEHWQIEYPFQRALRLKVKEEAKEDELPFTFFHTNSFNHEALPVVTMEEPDDISYYNWGLVPYWVKTKDQAGELRRMTLNATCENVFAKPSFKGSIFSKRCLIPATGFFEWRTEGKNKYPYIIMVKDDDFPMEDRPFCFGGIYDRWVDKSTGEVLNSFSIITVPANEKMEYIHNVKKRMPLILHKEDQSTWLMPELDEGHIKVLMQSYPNELVRAHTISKRITDRNANPNAYETIEAAEYAEVDSWID